MIRVFYKSIHKLMVHFLLIADTTQSQNVCFFGSHLSRSVTAVTEFIKCSSDSVLKSFSSLQPDLQEKIVYRSCIKEVNDDVMICSAHEKYLGNDYITRISGGNTYCLWPSHVGKRKSGTLRNPFPSKTDNAKKQSLYLYSNYSIVLPFQSKICKKCSKQCSENLKDFDEEQVRSPQIKRMVLNLDSESEPLSQSTFASQTSSYHPPSQDSEIQRNKKELLDELLKENRMKVNGAE